MSVLTVDADGPVRIVTPNRPDQLNAFSHELHEVAPNRAAQGARA